VSGEDDPQIQRLSASFLEPPGQTSQRSLRVITEFVWKKSSPEKEPTDPPLGEGC
jgi:hypothetical protein